MNAGDLGTAKTLGQVSPDERLAVGRFRGDKAADILIGQRLFVGGDPRTAIVLNDLPTPTVAQEDGA